MKNVKSAKNSVEMLDEISDLLWKRHKLFNWDTQITYLLPLADTGVDVTYLEDDEGWLQWDLAVKLSDR